MKSSPTFLKWYQSSHVDLWRRPQSYVWPISRTWCSFSSLSLWLIEMASIYSKESDSIVDLFLRISLISHNQQSKLDMALGIGDCDLRRSLYVIQGYLNAFTTDRKGWIRQRIEFWNWKTNTRRESRRVIQAVQSGARFPPVPFAWLVHVTSFW